MCLLPLPRAVTFFRSPSPSRPFTKIIDKTILSLRLCLILLSSYNNTSSFSLRPSSIAESTIPSLCRRSSIIKYITEMVIFATSLATGLSLSGIVSPAIRAKRTTSSFCLYRFYVASRKTVTVFLLQLGSMEFSSKMIPLFPATPTRKPCTLCVSLFAALTRLMFSPISPLASCLGLQECPARSTRTKAYIRTRPSVLRMSPSTFTVLEESELTVLPGRRTPQFPTTTPHIISAVIWLILMATGIPLTPTVTFCIAIERPTQSPYTSATITFVQTAS